MPLFLSITTTMAAPAYPSTYTDAVLHDDPAAYWDFNETDGSTITNHGSAGTVASGDIVGNVSTALSGFVETTGNLAMGFSRTNTPGRIEFGSSLSELTLTSGSWEIWLRLDDLQGQRIFGHTDSWAVEGQWMLFVQADGKLAFGLSDSDSQRVVTDITSSTWHHVAATWDGTELILYLDGVEADRTAAEAMTLDSTENVAVSVDSDSLGFSGQIDELAIYSSALSPSEVQNHFQTAHPQGETDSAPPEDETPSDTTGCSHHMPSNSSFHWWTLGLLVLLGGLARRQEELHRR